VRKSKVETLKKRYKGGKSMSTVVVQEETFKKANEGVATIKLRRTIGGAEIFIKSEQLEEFFKTLSNSRLSNEWLGHKAYEIPRSPLLEQLNGGQASLTKWGEATLYNTEYGYANISYIRAVGVANGVTFKIPGVYSIESIKSYAERLKNGVSFIYQNLMKTYSMEMTISTKEVM
jgi:hypothetical protein